MPIELAKLLLQDNDILLLDEPTNHLDIESVIWLKTFNKYRGAVVLVSHDKMFLDHTSNRTILLEDVFMIIRKHIQNTCNYAKNHGSTACNTKESG